MSTLLLQGNARNIPLADGSVDLVVCSPPYWGLRSYGTNPQIWGGRRHAHEWGPGGRAAHPWAVEHSLVRERGYSTGVQAAKYGGGHYCIECDAWRGELGGEPTVAQYVANMVEVFAEVRRVLAPHGLLFLNLGDCYSNAGRSNNKNTGGRHHHDGGKRRTTPDEGLGEKQLMLVPFRLAMALQESGWILRQWHPWIKRNPMPDSAGDRAGVAVEVFFQFAKSAHYYFDMEPVRRPTIKSHEQSIRDRERWRKNEVKGAAAGLYHPGVYFANDPHPAGRQWRNSDGWFTSLDEVIEQERDLLAHLERVRERAGALCVGAELLALDVATYSYPGAHYATFGPRLVEPLVKAGSSEAGCCPDCGKPWLRWKGLPAALSGSERPQARRAAELFAAAGLTEEHKQAIRAVGIADTSRSRHKSRGHGKNSARMISLAQEAKEALGGYYREFLARNGSTIGWAPSCSCYDARYCGEHQRARSERKQRQHDAWGQWWRRVRSRPGNPDWPRRAARVFDPFVGSGTTAVVAQELGRDGIGLDLSHDYLREQALPRVIAGERERAEQQQRRRGIEAALAGEPISAPPLPADVLGPLFSLELAG